MWKNYWDPIEEEFKTYAGNDYRTGEWGEGVVNSLSNIKVFKLIIDPIYITDGRIEEVPLNETIRFNLEIPFPPFYKCFGTPKPTRYTEPYATYESAMINDGGVGSGMNQKTYTTTKRNYLDFEVKIPWEPPPFSDRLEDARVGTLLNFPYSNRPHRYRLLPQAYGIGALKTEDHMKFSVMVPAPPPSDWYLEKLWIGDSFFYSPMIYDYFSAFTADPGNDALSLFYDDVYVKATRMEPETIIDKDGQGNWVEKEIYTPPQYL